MSGQLYALATLLLGQDPSTPTEQEARWVPDLV